MIILYLGWKIRTREWRLWIPAEEIDLTTDLRIHVPSEDDAKPETSTWKNLPKRIWRGVF